MQSHIDIVIAMPMGKCAKDNRMYKLWGRVTQNLKVGMHLSVMSVMYHDDA